MKVVLQRVSEACVSSEGQALGKIKRGLLVLLGIHEADTPKEVDWLVNKLTNLRIFPDESSKMNLSVKDINGEILLVSQFTLYGDARKGNRPSFIDAARPEKAIPLYKYFIEKCNEILDKPIEAGEFGAHMQVSLVNDGPVTLIIDSCE